MGLVYVLLLCVLVKASSQIPAQGLEHPMFLELGDGDGTHLVHTTGSASTKRLKNVNSDIQRLYLPNNNNLANANKQESLNFDQISRMNNILNANSQDNLDFNQKSRSNNLLNGNSQESLNFDQISRINNLLNTNSQDNLDFNQKSRSNNLLNGNSQEFLNFDQISRTNNLLNTNSQDNLDFNQKSRSNNLLNVNSQSSLNFNQTRNQRTNNLLNANSQDTVNFNQKSRSSNVLDSNEKNYLSLDQISRTNNLLNANSQNDVNFNQNSRMNNLLNSNEQSSLNFSQSGSNNNLINENSQHSMNFDQSRYGFSRPIYYNRNYYQALQNYMNRLSQYPIWSRRANNQQGNQDEPQSVSNAALANLLDMESLNKAKSRFSHLTTDTAMLTAGGGQATLETNDGFLGKDRLALTDTSNLSQMSQTINRSPVLTNSASVGGSINALDSAAQRKFDALNEASARFAELLHQANSDSLNTGTTTLSVQALKDEAKRRSDALDEITARFNKLQYQASTGLGDANDLRRLMYRTANLNAQSNNDNMNGFNADLSGRNQYNQPESDCSNSNARGNFAKRQEEAGRRMVPGFHNMGKRSVRAPGLDRNEYELVKHM